MFLIIIAMEILAAGALGTLLARPWRSLARLLGCGGAIAGCAAGLAGALQVLASGTTPHLQYAWSLPYGALHIEADPLSAFFLIPVFGLGALAALYGGEYLWAYRARKSMGRPWFFYNLLLIAMALVILSRDVVLFLIAWELMTLTSYFLVTFEDERDAVSRAGWTYLVASHLGTAALFLMFLLAGRAAGSLDFDRIAAAGPALAPLAGVFFVLAVAGFGTKAGIMPLHVWLPEAHPAAPSHVSALMSGVMIKTGVYGIMRVLTWLGAPPAWWAWLLIGIGVVSGIGGVLFALAQHDLKRLLAYSSVENIGIIFLGLGLGLLGRSAGSPILTLAGFGAALLHILNHCVFKGLLFLGAGSVLHATHTLGMDQAGGLLRRMPWTGSLFLAGSAAICALPPLNGFAGEFLIYFGALTGLQTMGLWDATAALAIIGALALIGGLAAACFTKAFGSVFLGEPRSPQAAAAHECGLAMRLPMAVLALLCLLLGLLAPLVLYALRPVLEAAAGIPADLAALHALTHKMLAVAAMGLGLIALAGALAWGRLRLLRGRVTGQAGTWDCGYARPTARMQYTASSFAQPLVDFFAALLRPRRRLAPPQGLFPARAALSTRIPDAAAEGLFCPVFNAVQWLCARLRLLQTGSVHLYILYIAATLIALLIWKLR